MERIGKYERKIARKIKIHTKSKSQGRKRTKD
jgi:hypothetical protein